MILFVCLISFSIFLILYCIIYNRRVRKFNNIPGPPTLPIIGNAHFLVGNPADFFKVLNVWAALYGTRFRVFVGNELFLFLYGVKDVEFVLSSNEIINKSHDYYLFKSWIGDGIPLSKDEKWRKQRKAIIPTFHFKILKNFIQVFDAQSNILVKKLSTHIDGKSFDVFEHIKKITIDVICETAMGVSIGAQNDPNSEFVHAIEEICRISMDRVKNPLKRSDFLYMFTRDCWQQRKAIKIVHDLAYKLIKERRQILEEEKTDFHSYSNDDDAVLSKKKQLTFLDMLLVSEIDGKPLNDVEIREQVDALIFAGHDTVVTGLSFALYLISIHPEIQKKIFNEQMDIFGNNFDRPVLNSDLQNMKYLELAIKETLRLYPSAPLIGRIVNKDITINDIFVPAGTTLAIPIYNVHRDPEVFPEPDKFIPERFLPDQIAKRSPFSTIAFSAGPRNCIGSKFAMLQMKLTISKILHNYELLPSNEKFTLINNVSLKTVEGLKLKVAKRLI